MQTFDSFVRLIEIRAQLESILDRYGVNITEVNLKRRWKTIANNPNMLVKGSMDHRDRQTVTELLETWGKLL